MFYYFLISEPEFIIVFSTILYYTIRIVARYSTPYMTVTIQNLQQTIDYTQNRINEIKASQKGRTLTLLDRDILKSFHLAQTKYEYQLSSYKVTDFVKTLMHNLYHEAIEKTTKNITHYEKDIYSRHINEGVLSLKVTYTTIPIHQIHIVNAIRNRKEVFRRSSGKFAIQNDYVNMELHVIDGNVTLLSEGDDLTKVWESILEINNIIISTSEHYLQGAWIICPNCVRKGNIDPCK